MAVSDEISLHASLLKCPYYKTLSCSSPTLTPIVWCPRSLLIYLIFLYHLVHTPGPPIYPKWVSTSRAAYPATATDPYYDLTCRRARHSLVHSGHSFFCYHRPAESIALVSQFCLSPPRATVKNGSVSDLQALTVGLNTDSNKIVFLFPIGLDTKKLRKSVCDLCCFGGRMTTHRAYDM